MICLLARWSYKKLTDTWTSAQSPELTYSMLHTHTHTQVLYYSQILLFRLISTHSEQPQNKLMLQFKMYVVGYYTVKGARIAIASLYNTFNELMHPIQ